MPSRINAGKRMRRFVLPTWLCVLVAAAVEPLVISTSAARTIVWDGYRWDARSQGLTPPGPNLWSASRANAHVDRRTGAMVLCYSQNASGRWTSTELDAQRHLGYGSYRWRVSTDMAGEDANQVLGLFTYDDYSPPSFNEIDIEYSHFGDPTNPLGDLTVWINQNAGVSDESVFRYPPAAKSTVNEFDWTPGRVAYRITSASTGAVIKSWTATRGVPVPHSEVPVMNWWRYGNAHPTGRLGDCVRVQSFTFSPYRK